MRTIVYDYQNGGPHGAIIAEKYPGVAVSSIQQDPDNQDSFIETRGDGPTRKFTYTQFTRCYGNECGCSDYDSNDPPQQMLKEYTDFQGHTTRLDYDTGANGEKWYVKSVKDANLHTTSYTRGPAPPQGIGQITKITYPDNTHIDYAYQDAGHHLISITESTPTNQRRSATIHTRDAKQRITQTDYQDGNVTLLARETFTYCDQADSQCSNNPLDQIKTHRLKNGAYVHYRYDLRGLLIDKWEPTWTPTASESEPKTHYDYYTTEYSYTATDGRMVYPWMDRLMTVTGPPPNWASLTARPRRRMNTTGSWGPTGSLILTARPYPGAAWSPRSRTRIVNSKDLHTMRTRTKEGKITGCTTPLVTCTMNIIGLPM